MGEEHRAVRDGRRTRGRLLSATTIGVGAVIAGTVAAPAAGYLLAPMTEEARFRPVRIGTLADFPHVPGFQPVARTFVEDPTTPVTSIQLAYVQRGPGGSRDWLAQDTMLVVWSNHCTHVGCPVQATGIGFGCPCHGSQYDRRGERIAGPAVRALDRFQWAIRGRDEVWLTARWSVAIAADRVAYYPYKQPGQPLTIDGSRAIADAIYPAVTYTG